MEASGLKCKHVGLICSSIYLGYMFFYIFSFLATHSSHLEVLIKREDKMWITSAYGLLCLQASIFLIICFVSVGSSTMKKVDMLVRSLQGRWTALGGSFSDAQWSVKWFDAKRCQRHKMVTEHLITNTFSCIPAPDINFIACSPIWPQGWKCLSKTWANDGNDILRHKP